MRVRSNGAPHGWLLAGSLGEDGIVVAMEASVASLMAWAGSRHGLFRLEDARRLGVTDRQVERLVGAGRAERVAPATYRVVGAPVTPEQALLAFVWSRGPDGLASHRSAAWLWRLATYRAGPPEVLLPIGRSQRGTVGRVHLTRLLPPEHRSAVEGIPVTSTARTLFDLAAVDRPRRVEVALDDALARKLCTLRQVNMALFALARRGRSGVGTMRQLLAERGEGEVVPASQLEARFRHLLRQVDLPMPDFEVDLGDESWIGRVDVVWREARLVVELDGRRWHDGRLALERDSARDNRLMAQGWRVLRFTWDDVVNRPREVVATIRRALGLLA
jgi:hypothetical protein